MLIADDEKDVGKVLAEMVRSCNHEIVGVVGSGLEAIHAYTQCRPDLVLMDYRMAKLNGATACRNILSKDPAARVILVSAFSAGFNRLLSARSSALAGRSAFFRNEFSCRCPAESSPTKRRSVCVGRGKNFRNASQHSAPRSTRPRSLNGASGMRCEPHLYFMAGNAAK